jgi:hypothetical protein
LSVVVVDSRGSGCVGVVEGIGVGEGGIGGVGGVTVVDGEVVYE